MAVKNKQKLKETQWLKAQEIITAYKCVVTQCILHYAKSGMSTYGFT